MAFVTLPKSFLNLQKIYTNWWDDCFNAIVAQVNGNLDETNVKMSADCKKAGGFTASGTPGANTIIPLDANHFVPLAQRPINYQKTNFTYFGTPTPSNSEADIIAPIGSTYARFSARVGIGPSGTESDFSSSISIEGGIKIIIPKFAAGGPNSYVHYSSSWIPIVAGQMYSIIFNGILVNSDSWFSAEFR